MKQNFCPLLLAACLTVAACSNGPGKEDLAADADSPTGKNADAVSASGLHYREARVAVTGWDVNRPDPFPGLGDFIGWTGGVARLSSGELLLVNSAGYWHASFATPMILADATRKRYAERGYPLDWKAPTGGRVMAERSTDGGKTWSRPVSVYDSPLDDVPSNLFLTRHGTVLLFVNVQSSWYGFEAAPPGQPTLNTEQRVLRSTDQGRTWSEPIRVPSVGNHYERSASGAIQLPDGGILWQTYDMDTGKNFGTTYTVIHRSDDDGRTWRAISTVRRDGIETDEGDLGRLSDGRLIMVVRPDGAVFTSQDQGVNWKQTSRMGPEIKAPAIAVLPDDTVVAVVTIGTLHALLSRDGGQTWSRPIALDPSSYGYPNVLLQQDGTLLVAYSESGRPPNRCYLLRLRVTPARDGIELLPLTG